LFRNVTPGGNWLAIKVTGRRPTLNSMGIGAVVRIYEAGHLGDAKYLLGRRDIVIGTGYASTEEARAHFGLDQVKHCDVEVIWSDQRITQPGIATNQVVALEVK
jgi:hypothetical protein